jgi:hypothetical protein
MASTQPVGGAGHNAILFRGANGSLWFMRDDANAPVKVDRSTTAQINAAMGPLPPGQWITSTLNPAVIAILNTKYGPIQPDGVIHGVAGP